MNEAAAVVVVRGERRCVAGPPRLPAVPRAAGFSLVEVLVVVGIIALLIGMLLPTLHRVREHATIVRCANNLRQIGIAFNGYMIDSRGMIFWQAERRAIDGMERWAFGGRDSDNLNNEQEGLFNRVGFRPLNPYVDNVLEVFKCPADLPGHSPWTIDSSTNFEWVGNSYAFNAQGNTLDTTRNNITSGLSGVRITSIRDVSNTVLFVDGYLTPPPRGPPPTIGNWHNRPGMGNICFLDSHVEFVDRRDGPYSWNDQF